METCDGDDDHDDGVVVNCRVSGMFGSLHI